MVKRNAGQAVRVDLGRHGGHPSKGSYVLTHFKKSEKFGVNPWGAGYILFHLIGNLSGREKCGAGCACGLGTARRPSLQGVLCIDAF